MRKSGILLPITSLPSPYGVGTLGRAAFDFVDFLAAAGQSLWQMLPPGPTGFGDSPYQSFSAFAGNPYLIDLDILAHEGYLAPEEIGDDWGKDAALADYGRLFERRFAVLAGAVRRQDKTAPEYMAFCREQAWWLEDYALYRAAKEAQGHIAFQEWPEDLRRHEKRAVQKAEAMWGPRVEFYRCLQYFFFKQWRTLKAYAQAQGVELVGDIPIYVSPDSSDLWANPELFQLDAELRPTAVAGVPPDAFSDTGQLWGNPLYDWPHHKRTKYEWWLKRLRFAAMMFDRVRIDHFRGFASYYAVPAGEDTAVNGRWRPGPGKDFIRAVHKALPHLSIIAEDLGYLTDEVRDLLAYSRYPGMKVLQFAFDSREESDYLPHNYPRHCVVYTGTHDNTTTEDWKRSAPPDDVAFAKRYLGLAGGRGTNFTDGVIRAALQSVADTAIIPLQDWLHLPLSGRFNTPSTLGGRNWRWRLVPGQLTGALAEHIREETQLYGRLSARAKAALALEAELAAAAEAQHQPVARVLTRDEMKQAEDAAAAAGTSHEVLMENAGRAAAAEIASLVAPRTPESLRAAQKTLLLLCGKGNNAGDAFVIARLLAAQGWRVEWVPLAGETFSELAAKNHSRLPVQVLRQSAATADWDAAVIVDAVFGTGFAGAQLPPAVGAAFRRAAGTGAVQVALDVPSGLDCDTGAAAPDTFAAGLTLAFGALKPALLMESAQDLVGQVKVLDIGL